MGTPRATATSEVASATGALAGIGGAATAAAVSACCAGPAFGPILVSLLGAGGAVTLEGLRPYALPLLALSGVAIGASFWLAAHNKACAAGRRRSPLGAVSRGVLWVSALIWFGAVGAVVWARVA